MLQDFFKETVVKKKHVCHSLLDGYKKKFTLNLTLEFIVYFYFIRFTNENIII